MSRSSFAFAAAAACIGLLAAASGCSDDESPRSVVSIDQMNGSQTLDCDVYNNGEDKQFGTEDDFIIEDQIPVVVRNRVHDGGLNIRANGPFSAVVFYRYEVRFQGDESLPTIFGAMHLRVLSGSTGTGEITVIPASYKTVPPLRQLREGGEIRFMAEVTLVGEEEDSRDEVVVRAILPVHCANWGDKS